MEAGETKFLDSTAREPHRTAISRSLDFVKIFPSRLDLRPYFCLGLPQVPPQTHFERFPASAYVSRGYKPTFLIEQVKKVNKDVFRD